MEGSHGAVRLVLSEETSLLTFYIQEARQHLYRYVPKSDDLE